MNGRLYSSNCDAVQCQRDEWQSRLAGCSLEDMAAWHCKRSSHSCCSKQKFKGGHPPFFVRESLSDYLGKSCDKRAHNKWYKAKIEVRNLARSNVAKAASSANRNFGDLG